MAGDWDLCEDLINFGVLKDARGFLLKWSSFLDFVHHQTFSVGLRFGSRVCYHLQVKDST